MAKKINLPLLFICGLALVVVGFSLPVFASKLGSMNGWKFIDFDKITFLDIGALLIPIGAILGIIFCFVGKNDTLKIVGLLLSIAGIIVLYFGIANDKMYSFIAKQFFKHIAYGFYIMIAGYVASLLGFILKK